MTKTTMTYILSVESKLKFIYVIKFLSFLLLGVKTQETNLQSNINISHALIQLSLLRGDRLVEFIQCLLKILFTPQVISLHFTHINWNSFVHWSLEMRTVEDSVDVSFFTHHNCLRMKNCIEIGEHTFMIFTRYPR